MGFKLNEKKPQKTSKIPLNSLYPHKNKSLFSTKKYDNLE
jgi:hypothetical protein